MSRITAPRRGSAHRAELAVLGVAAGLWLAGWAALELAVAVAGGSPQGSPLDLLDPSRLARQLRADGGRLVWWHLVGAEGEVSARVFWVVLGAAALVAALTAGGLRLALGRGLPGPLRRRLAPRSLRRVSRWASRPDLRRLLVRRPGPGSLLLGRRGAATLATERETSVLVIGPTRSGKTSSLVVPNLFAWRGPAVVTSTKSELVEITAGHRQRLGPVHVYDPTGEIADRYPGVSWSPLVGCADLDRAWVVASWLCAGLQQGGGRSDNDWSHWAESGRLLIAPLLHCAAVTPGRTIVDVRDWIHCFDLDTPLSLLQERAAASDDPDSDARRSIGMLMAVDQRPEKERGTVFSTVTRIFSVLNERAVASSATTSRFSARELCQGRGTLYLCTPSRSPERVASLFVGILMTVVTQAHLIADRSPRGRLEPELGLFLDELANVVPIEDLPSLASQGAGRGVILMSIVQDLSQLRSRYGAERSNSILNNHGARVFLPGIADPETCELVARMVGRADHTELSLSDQNGRTSRSFSVRQDQLASPEALRQLPEGTAVILYRGRPPALVRLRPWFSDRALLRLSRRHFFRRAEHVAIAEPRPGRPSRRRSPPWWRAARP